MPTVFVHIHQKKNENQSCFPLKRADCQNVGVRLMLSGTACEQKQDGLLSSSMPILLKKGLLHSSDRLVRNHRNRDTTPSITIEFKVCTAPVAVTSACESNYQARLSTSSSAAECRAHAQHNRNREFEAYSKTTFAQTNVTAHAPACSTKVSSRVPQGDQQKVLH